MVIFRQSFDPTQDRHCLGTPHWVRLRYNFAGTWEIDPHGIEEHARALQILDAREPEELTGPLGRIRGAKLILVGRLGRAANRQTIARSSPLPRR